MATRDEEPGSQSARGCGGASGKAGASRICQGSTDKRGTSHIAQPNSQVDVGPRNNHNFHSKSLTNVQREERPAHVAVWLRREGLPTLSDPLTVRNG
mmetsp:Transcript_53328/g.141364  ORF Transcript_53328/g.141364 Transcript_53328/m.141364 type:complete len:97 (+) Transcript_53328:287-577(+)